MTIKSLIFLFAIVFVETSKASYVEDVVRVLTEHGPYAQTPGMAPVPALSRPPVSAPKKAPAALAPAKAPIPTPNKAPVYPPTISPSTSSSRPPAISPSTSSTRPPAISPSTFSSRPPVHPPIDHPTKGCTAMCIKYCEPSSSSKTCIEACIFVCKKTKCVPGLMECPNWNKNMMGLISEANSS